ncbi:hypothetical protein [Candidatus Microthrix parvicella]|uniref:hypothetical protein n=1 Tax=Candidatus Neomicrothrix parvicella TaxID=41950 RepID=UPI0004B9CA53|nr:hypothetical protein [Candidatus Microthrix parvicella]
MYDNESGTAAVPPWSSMYHMPVVYTSASSAAAAALAIAIAIAIAIGWIRSSPSKYVTQAVEARATPALRVAPALHP